MHVTALQLLIDLAIYDYKANQCKLVIVCAQFIYLFIGKLYMHPMGHKPPSCSSRGERAI